VKIDCPPIHSMCLIDVECGESIFTVAEHTESLLQSAQRTGKVVEVLLRVLNIILPQIFLQAHEWEHGEA
jgi:diphthamide biosynthesis methyltransferase